MCVHPSMRQEPSVSGLKPVEDNCEMKTEEKIGTGPRKGAPETKDGERQTDP